MIRTGETNAYRVGKAAGFLFSFCLFTTFLYIFGDRVIGFLEGAAAPVFPAITATVIVAGYGIRRAVR